MTTKPEIPAGYWQDAKGNLVPEAMIKPIDRARNDLTHELAAAAAAMQGALRELKTRVFDDINAFVNLSAEQYGVNWGGKKGNVTLYSFDGKYKIQVAVADRLVFDERLQAAKELIDQCIHAWAQDSRDEIKALINDAFQTDKEGRINTGRVLGLRRLDIRDSRWLMAMTAISESAQVVGSKEYVRFYERVGNSDQYVPVNLSIAAV